MYVETEIRPRFCETDALGHINNTVLPVWFEDGRSCLLQQLPRGAEQGVAAHLAIDFLAELRLRPEVIIRTGIHKVGLKSYEFYQEAWQREKICARAWVVIVRWDPRTRQTCPIPEDERMAFEAFMFDESLRANTARERSKAPF